MQISAGSDVTEMKEATPRREAAHTSRKVEWINPPPRSIKCFFYPYKQPYLYISSRNTSGVAHNEKTWRFLGIGRKAKRTQGAKLVDYKLKGERKQIQKLRLPS